jgi:hypothetical protein
LVSFAGLASGSAGTFSLPLVVAVAFGFIWISLALNQLKTAAQKFT